MKRQQEPQFVKRMLSLLDVIMLLLGLFIIRMDAEQVQRDRPEIQLQVREDGAWLYGDKVLIRSNGDLADAVWHELEQQFDTERLTRVYLTYPLTDTPVASVDALKNQIEQRGDVDFDYDPIGKDPGDK